MKKFSVLLSVLIFGTIVFMASCGGSGSSSPGEVVKAYYQKVEKGDAEAALDYIDFEGKELTAEDKEKLIGLLGEGTKQMEEKGGIKSFEIVEENIAEDGNTADVSFKIIYGNDKEEENKAKVAKVDGNWKLKFN